MFYDEMWETMKIYHSKFEHDSIWLCVLCQKLLIDTHESPCGCNFCKQCITDYLKSDNKFCPSENDNCKLIKLNLKENIVKIKSIDRKISELKIQCPLDLCDYKTELMYMCNHIKDCDTSNQRLFTKKIIKENNKTQAKSYIQVLFENLTKEFQSIKSIVNNIENKCINQEAKFEQWKTNFQSSLERLYDEYINKNKIQRKRKLGKSDRLNLNQSNQSINFCDFRQKTCSNFTWRINEGLKMKNNISSGDFLTKNNLFLMKLELSHRNPTEQIDWDVRIRLFVKYNLNDENFQDGIALPFDIVIIVKNLRNIFFNLKKSNFSEIKIFKHFYVNKSFDFSYRELEEAGINPGQPIIIECKFDVN